MSYRVHLHLAVSCYISSSQPLASSSLPLAVPPTRLFLALCFIFLALAWLTFGVHRFLLRVKT